MFEFRVLQLLLPTWQPTLTRGVALGPVRRVANKPCDIGDLSRSSEWARHFGHLEQEMDQLLADLFGVKFEEISAWINPGRYIGGREMAKAGLAELIDLMPIATTESNGAPRKRRSAKLRK